MTIAVLSKFSTSFGYAALGLVVSGAVCASGQVSSVQTSSVLATPFSYTANGTEYRWGMGSNQLLESFTISDGQMFGYATSADRVELLRDDIVGVTTGEPCGIFVERLADGNSQRTFAADYPSDGSGTGNCDMGALLSSRVVNRGAVDLFSNTVPDAKNIERLDYVYDYGVLAPLVEESMHLAGHLTAEKSGNNPVKVAAILQLDIFGQPSAYGPMVMVGAVGCSNPAVCYGMTDLRHQYSFLQNDFNQPQSFPVETERSNETVGMAFVSLDDLGLSPGQRYFGFSVFAYDVDATAHNLLDPGTFPDDTSADNVLVGDDADIYGGLAGYFIADTLSVVTGAVFNDIDGNGEKSSTEAGISDISIRLHVDVNGNGLLDPDVDLPLGDPIDSDISGGFVIPGLPDGDYLVILDETDIDLPPGLVSVPGTNPHVLTVVGIDPQPVYFPFTDSNGSGGSDGGSTGGADDGGSDGATDSGGTDGGTGGSTDSGGTDGATDAGTTDGGTSGSTDSGTTDGGTSGSTDSGTTDGGTSGSTDSGTTDGGTTDGSTGGSTGGGTSDGGSDGNPPIGDGATQAIDDTVVINQGQTAIIDVLSNDKDGAGGGLSLLSVSNSANATITIVDNRVTYVPNYGFYGTDSFLYVIEDADGTRGTGNVSVSVLRYSDLNGNMVNDFVECACSDLTLQTGVHGSGIGAVSWPAALLLAVGVWLRRWRKLAIHRQNPTHEVVE